MSFYVNELNPSIMDKMLVDLIFQNGSLLEKIKYIKIEIIFHVKEGYDKYPIFLIYTNTFDDQLLFRSLIIGNIYTHYIINNINDNLIDCYQIEFTFIKTPPPNN